VLRRKSSKPKKAKKAAKPKKDKKAKSTSKKARPSRREGVVVKKADTDVYTIMLVISLAAILTACLLMWFELKSYGDFPQWKV